jgi:hypothetical protein
MTLCDLCAALTVQALYELAQVGNKDAHLSMSGRAAPANRYAHAKSFLSLTSSAQNCDLCLAIRLAFETTGFIHDVRDKEAKGQATDVKLWLETGLDPLYSTSSGRKMGGLKYLAVQVGREEHSGSSSVMGAIGDENSSDTTKMAEEAEFKAGLKADLEFELGIAALRDNMLRQSRLSSGVKVGTLHPLEDDLPEVEQEDDLDAQVDGLEDQWASESDVDPDWIDFFDPLQTFREDILEAWNTKVPATSEDQQEDEETIAKPKKFKPSSQ